MDRAKIDSRRKKKWLMLPRRHGKWNSSDKLPRNLAVNHSSIDVKNHIHTAIKLQNIIAKIGENLSSTKRMKFNSEFLDNR